MSGRITLAHPVVTKTGVGFARTTGGKVLPAWSIIRQAGRTQLIWERGAHTTKERLASSVCVWVRLHASDVNYSRDWPALEEVDVVELVELDAELHGGLQLAHGYLCRCLPTTTFQSITLTLARAAFNFRPQ